MTTTTPGGLRSVVAKLVSAGTQVLIASTGVLVVVGLIAVLSDHYGLALSAILVLQAALAGYLVTSPSQAGVSERSVQRQVDAASARTLADLTRARTVILEAIAATAPRDER